jgi:uncharacterized protein YjbJ (UPF0337 family)
LADPPDILSPHPPTDNPFLFSDTDSGGRDDSHGPAPRGARQTTQHYWGYAHVAVSQQTLVAGVAIMSGKTEVAKGRFKEVAGALTGNDELRAEGETDQTIGKVKQVAEKAIDKVQQAVKKVRK